MRIWNFSSEVWILRILILLTSYWRRVHRLLFTPRWIYTVDLMDIDVIESGSIIVTLRSIWFARLRMLLIRNLLHWVHYNNFIIFLIWIEVFRRLLSLNPPRFMRRPTLSILSDRFAGRGLLRTILRNRGWFL